MFLSCTTVSAHVYDLHAHWSPFLPVLLLHTIDSSNGASYGPHCASMEVETSFCLWQIVLGFLAKAYGRNNSPNTCQLPWSDRPDAVWELYSLHSSDGMLLDGMLLDGQNGEQQDRNHANTVSARATKKHFASIPAIHGG